MDWNLTYVAMKYISFYNNSNDIQSIDPHLFPFTFRILPSFVRPVAEQNLLLGTLHTPMYFRIVLYHLRVNSTLKFKQPCTFSLSLTTTESGQVTIPINQIPGPRASFAIASLSTLTPSPASSCVQSHLYLTRNSNGANPSNFCNAASLALTLAYRPLCPIE
jgi:hypothetical protein